MQEYAKSFYKSKAWQACRDAYMHKANGLCERCLKRGMIVPGEIVHHKIHITPENIKDPSVTLNPDNLELVCRLCHAEEHTGKQLRYTIDELGRVTARY